MALLNRSASLFLRKLDEIDRTPGIDEGSAKLCAIHWTTGRQVASSSKKALQGEMLHKAIVVSNACFQQHQKVVCEFHDIREGRLRVYFVKFERGRDGDFVTLDYTLRSAPKDWVIYKLDTTSAPKSPTLREITHQFVQMSAKMGGYSVRWSNCWMMARIFTVLIAGPIVHDLGFEHIALLTRTYKEQIRWLTALIGVYRRLDMLLLPQLWVSGLESLKALHLPSLSKLDSGGNEAAIQVRDRRWEQEESEKWWQSYREREEWRRSLGCSGKVNV